MIIDQDSREANGNEAGLDGSIGAAICPPQRHTSTIIVDHENQPFRMAEFEQLHRILEELGAPPCPPHYAVRATWDWRSIRRLQLGNHLIQAGYQLLTCPPGRDAADRVLGAVAGSFLGGIPRTLVIVGGDGFFAPIAWQFCYRTWKVMVVARDRNSIACDLREVTHKVLTLNPKMLATTDTPAIDAINELPEQWRAAILAIINAMRLIRGGQDCGHNGCWVDLIKIDQAVAQLPEHRTPKAAGFRSVLRLVNACLPYGMFEVRPDPKHENLRQVRYGNRLGHGHADELAA